MATKTPIIKRIIRMTEFDQLRTAYTEGNMYMCLDSQKLYYDEPGNRRVVYFYQGVKTYNDLIYNITPALNTTYYCWEDNSLWLWLNKWIALWSDKTYPSAYVYDDWDHGKINSVYRYDQPLLPADDNGLLHDGSVVIRDRQRIIKGKIFVNDGNDNLVISSFLGGGVRILPNGQISTEGELFIGDEGKSFIRAQFHHLNNETYVDYSEVPELDPSEFMKDSHIYKIYHEGNLNASLIREITPEEIYNKLLAPELPQPFAFNVSKLNGKTLDYFAPKEHYHIAEDITDFDTAAREQALVLVKQVFNNMEGKGIVVSFSSPDDQLLMSADDFNLTLVGDVSGTATIRHLTDTTMNVTVDGTKHTHNDYVERMNYLQDQINDLATLDPADYYTKPIIDEKLLEVSGTAEPTPGSPLLVNDDGILPGIVDEANKFTRLKTVNYIGDVTGVLSTDFTEDNINVSLDASNILSSTPTPGKALRVNNDGNLPANAITSSALNHTIGVSVSGEALGNATLDTSADTFNIDLTLIPGNNILQDTDIGVRVPGLDVNGKVPTSQLPEQVPAIYPQGYFNPENGLPTDDPLSGYFWVASDAGEIDGDEYQVGDWLIYLNSQWNHINTNQNVLTVNGHTGHVVLGPDDVNAISTEYLNYTLGDTIPSNKVVQTSSNGIIEGASVGNLTNPFSIGTDNTGDVIISPSSTNTSSDGSTNFNLKLELTQSSYDKIIENAGLVIKNNDIALEHRPNLNFTRGVKAALSSDPDNIDVYLDSGLGDVAVLYWDPENDTQFKETLSELYPDRATRPIMVCTTYDNMFFSFIIDGNYISVQESGTVSIEPDRYVYEGKKQEYGESLNQNIYRLVLDFIVTQDEVYVDNVSISQSSDEVLPTYLPIIVDATASPFIPYMDSQPATKKYVDDMVAQGGGGGSGVPFTEIVGNGVDTSFVIDHNLNSRDLIVQVYSLIDYQDVFPTVYRTALNYITVEFDNPPAQDEYQVVISMKPMSSSGGSSTEYSAGDGIDITNEVISSLNSNLVNGNTTGSLCSVGSIAAKSNNLGNHSMALGDSCTARGDYAFAEGYSTDAIGDYSHAEGRSCDAEGMCSHSEGSSCRVIGDYSHAEGVGAFAISNNQHVQGKWNLLDEHNKYAHILGNGNSLVDRSNAHTIDWEGTGWFAKTVKVGGTNQDDAKEVALADNVIDNYYYASGELSESDLMEYFKKKFDHSCSGIPSIGYVGQPGKNVKYAFNYYQNGMLTYIPVGVGKYQYSNDYELINDSNRIRSVEGGDIISASCDSDIWTINVNQCYTLNIQSANIQYSTGGRFDNYTDVASTITNIVTAENGSFTIKNTENLSWDNTVRVKIVYTDGSIGYTDTYEGGGTVCFSSDTLVSAKEGLKEIKDIDIGDKVYSYNTETNTVELKEVDKIYTHKTNKLYNVYTDNEIIQVTGSHPFYVLNRGSVKVKNLNIGDILRTKTKLLSKINQIIVTEEQNIDVYEIRVKDNHTYFVGNNSYLVYNETSIIDDKN